MYSRDDLLQLLYSEGADELKLRVGAPAVMVVRGEPHPIDALSMTNEDAAQLLQSLANTRQRRELRERGVVQFLYTRSFSKQNQTLTEFLVSAKLEGEQVGLDIQRQVRPSA